MLHPWQKQDTSKIIWLIATLVLLWFMVMLGGATRLTQSGLSIVEWKPITGAIPPLSLNDWMIEFDKYKTTPEYLSINLGMSLTDFKFIYFMEYAHRLLGRLIGLVFALPLFLFWRSLTPKQRKQSLIVFGLGAAQGFMGWYMVKSGLSKEPHVSHYRLTAHLGLAFIIIAMISSMLFDILRYHKKQTQKRTLIKLSTGFIIATMIYGGFTAGLKAGLIYNTFPLMEGTLFPTDGLFLKPVWLNFFENEAAVQWTHRILATMALLHVGLFYKSHRAPEVKLWFLMILTQYLLGIITLIHIVPVSLGTLHQGFAVLVLIMTTFIWRRYKTD